jgi:hypothetical protein
MFAMVALALAASGANAVTVHLLCSGTSYMGPVTGSELLALMTAFRSRLMSPTTL